MPLPAGYIGAVVNVTDKTAPVTSSTSRSSQSNHVEVDADDDREDGEDEEAQEEMEEVKLAENLGEFESIVIWEHGGTIDSERDAYVRGLGEWIEFASGMHCDDSDSEVVVEKGKEQ